MLPVVPAMQALLELVVVAAPVARVRDYPLQAAAQLLVDLPVVPVVLVQPALALQQEMQEQMELVQLMQPQEIQEQLVMQDLRLLQPWQDRQEQMDLVQLVEQQEMVAMRVVRELRLHL